MRRCLYKDVGTLKLKQGKRARLLCKIASGLSFSPEEGCIMHFVPPRIDVPRAAKVLDSKRVEEGVFQLALDCDEDDLGELDGMHCLVDASLVSVPGSSGASVPDWVECIIGFSAFDAALGEIGEVADVIDNPAHPIAIVKRPSGAEAMIPLVDEFVASVDLEGRSLMLDCPKGLLEIG